MVPLPRKRVRIASRQVLWSSPASGGGGPSRSDGGGGKSVSAKPSLIRPNELKSRALAKSLCRSMTHAEALLWTYLRRDAIDGFRIRRQHPIGPYVADFACTTARLVIEVDGATHGSEAQVAHDAWRRAFFAAHGWREIRFTNGDVYGDLNGVLAAIWHEVKLGSQQGPLHRRLRRRSPSPASGGGPQLPTLSDPPRLRGRGTIAQRWWRG
ncbi:MAG: DUF559 domain-containing protein [Alphaproteobacteria bacterium]|nr:DUF559 domain-containing protein [Alphaproteobacteria bacterium]